jgi:hypothetical protein
VSTTEDAQLLALLLDDPVLELAALADDKEFSPGGAGFRPMPDAVKTRNQALATRVGAIAAGIRAMLPAPVQGDHAIPDVISTAFDAAARSNRTLTTLDLIDPLVRSITAGLYSKVIVPHAVEDDVSWAELETLVQRALEEALGGQRGWAGDKAKSALLKGVTLALRSGGRTRLMEMMSLFVGDVVTYVSRRNKILDMMEAFVGKEIEETPGPLWLVGHSLGGIISFDYCNRGSRAVERLITVGSQVGIFGEFGSLEREQRQNPVAKFDTPPNVGTWLNLYDPDDMLSFLAMPVFTRVTDIEIDTKAPFPIAHSEYWKRSDVYEKLCAEA